MKYIFEKKQHEEHGGYGFVLQGMDFAEPLAGMGAIHDIMEHFKTDEGNETGELQALGASFFTRGQEYLYRKNQYDRTPVDNMVMEFYNILNYLQSNNQDLDKRFVTIKQKSRAIRNEGEVDIWCGESAKGMMRDNETMGALMYMGVEKKYWPIIQHNICHWLRTGYRRAKKRYSNTYTDQLSYTFYEMEKKMDFLLPKIDEVIEVVVVHFYPSDPEAWKIEVDFNEEHKEFLRAEGVKRVHYSNY